MGFAKHAALKSKDSTQVGAVAIGLHKQVVETGFNGPPRGVLDSPERRERPAKYLFAAHAEANLVATAARARLEGTTVYVTHFCCSGCAKPDSLFDNSSILPHRLLRRCAPRNNELFYHRLLIILPSVGRD